MKRIVLLALLAAMPAAWAVQLRSDAEIRRILAERIKGFEQRVGLVVGVIGPEGRKIVAYGSMGVNDPRPVNGDTLYEIGSITKVFTSLLLADMVERGEVALDDPVARYPRFCRRIGPAFPGCPRISMREIPSILTWTIASSGSTNSFPVTRCSGTSARSTSTRILGAGLLGHALSRRAGTDYESLLRERVFRPLGMNSTGIALTPALKSRLSTAHSSVFRLAPTPLWDFTEAFAGAGALRSSANDLLTFLAASLGHTKTPLSGAMARMLTVLRDAGDNLKIGLGWRVEPRAGMEIVWHGGATYGSRTFTGYDPRSRVGIVVLSNYNSGLGIDDIGRYLLDPNAAVDDGSRVKPSERTAVTLAPELLNAYPGRYRFSDKEIWTVRRDGGRFFVQKPAEAEFEIFPEGDFAKGNDDFFSKNADAMFTFDFDKESPGVASQLTFRWAFLEPRRGRRIE